MVTVNGDHFIFIYEIIKYIITYMKTLKEYIKENNDQIKTQEVVNVLKDGGETSQEIKQDVDTKQKYINYKQLVIVYTKKCFEFLTGLDNLIKMAAKEEGNDFLERNFGKDWVIEFRNKLKEFEESVNKLNKQLSEDINESISVSKIKNYQNLYKFFTMLKQLDDIMVNWEKGNIKDNEFKNLQNICNEIFGEDNFVGKLILQTATDNNPGQINTEHEYIVCYCKNRSLLPFWYAKSEKAEKIQNKYLELKSKYSNDITAIQDELRKWIKTNEKDLSGVAHYDNVDAKGVFHDGDIANTTFGGYEYDVIHPVTGKLCKIPDKGFRFSEETMREMIENDEIMFGVDETTLIKPKKRIENAKDVLRSMIYEDGRTSTKKFIKNLMEIYTNNLVNTILLSLSLKNAVNDVNFIILDANVNTTFDIYNKSSYIFFNITFCLDFALSKLVKGS